VPEIGVTDQKVLLREREAARNNLRQFVVEVVMPWAHFGCRNLGKIGVAQLPDKQHLTPVTGRTAAFFGNPLVDHTPRRFLY
jgi:hypothetical protein